MSRAVVPESSTPGAGAAPGGATRSGPAGRGRRWPGAIALVAGAVAVVSAVLLPLAPVSMSQPVVSWPQAAAAPTSTMLQLTAQTPLSLDLRTSCAAARVAGGTDDGVLFATVVPGQPSTGGEGLLMTVADGGLDVRAGGESLVAGLPVAGDCEIAVTGDAAQGLTVTRDGEVVGRGVPGSLPAVDVLATSVTSLSPADGEQLAVELTVDDQFATSPSPLKWVLIALVALGAVVCSLFLLAERRADRAGAPPVTPAPRRSRRFRPVDVVVPLVMVAWVFLAPMSDDDGYYAAMARNAADEGAVGNYYQLLNQNFTPFTWFYRFLGIWQHVGDSPVVLRIPALVTGLLTWVVLRRFTTQPGALPAVLQRSRRGRLSLDVLLALATLAWWLPYGMGVRPEAVVGFLAAATLLAVSSAVRRRSLPLAALAVVAAAMSVVSHPTGFVALAPLLAGLPALGRLVGEGVSRGRAWLRGLAVIAPGAVAAIAAFGDGTYNDFRRGQEIFLSIQAQNSWLDEYQRWQFLFSPIAMGSYAKRAAVLLAVASLLWFAVLAVASRRRGAVPPQLLLAGKSLGLGFLLLWITPSKWTHHFGALDGLGPAFLALFLTSLPVLVRALPGGLRSRWLVPAAAIGTAAVVFALSLHGPNQWAYSWLQGVPHPFVPPHLAGIGLDSLVLWLAGIVALVVLVRLAGRRLGLPRRRPWLAALPVAASTFLAVVVVHLFGGFAYAAATTMDSYSPWADAVADPLGTRCGPAQAIDVLDVEAARPLPAVPGSTAATEVFDAGAGWYPPSPPPAEPGSGPVADVWGSLEGETDGGDVGEATSPWYELPAELAADEQVAVLVSGKLDEGGNRLVVEYGRSGSAGVDVVGSAEIRDGAQAAVWRTHAVDVPAARAAGADAIRLVAVDGTTEPSGWLAFSGPSVVPVVSLSEYLPEDAAVATAWQFAFLFPCQRQLDISNGITEPMEYAVMWGDGGVNSLWDNTWRLDRGGLFAPTPRHSSLTMVGGTFRDWPGITDVQVFRVVAPYPEDAYDVRETTVDRWGWEGPEEARWRYAAP
ncbi:arabinosyltransferase domain-containing protein [Modestobacter sp. SYSU DS0657]